MTGKFERFAVRWLLPRNKNITYYKGYAVGYKLIFWGLWVAVWALWWSGHLVLV